MNDGIYYVGLDIPEHLLPTVKEGLMRRRLASMNGACPCGATLALPNRAERRKARWILHAEVRHADECPAIALATLAWLRGAR